MNTFLNIQETLPVLTFLEKTAQIDELRRRPIIERIYWRGLYEQFKAEHWEDGKFRKRKAKAFNRRLLDKLIYRSEEV